jgi:hypothetical protein
MRRHGKALHHTFLHRTEILLDAPRSFGRPALLVVLAILCASCGKPEAPAAAGNRVSASPPPAAVGPRNYIITATDYAYTGLPVHAPSGWVTLRLANRGTEQHMLGVLAVPAGYTAGSLVDSIVHLHVPQNAKSWAGVDVVSPGDTATISAVFAPGQYAVGCFVKSPDGAFHVVKGMVGSFDVVATQDTGSAPATDAVVTMTGSDIKLAGATLRSGVRRLRVVSDGSHYRDFQLLKLLPGRSSQDALTWYANRATMAPAATAIGGVSGMDSGQNAVMTANFTPGSYVMLFDIQDAHGRPGFAHRSLTIPAR